MGRLSLLPGLVAVAVLIAAGCGEGEPVSDSDIIAALKLEQSPGTSGYSVGGDPFCAVNDDLLNNSDEVDTASQADELGLVITSPDESVGIQAEPPFDRECAREVTRGLDELD